MNVKGDLMDGWIKLYRVLLEKPIWKLSTPEQKTILITLLCMVNHDEEEWEWKGKKYRCKPGQKITSLTKIKKECGKGISIQNIRTAFVRFEKLEFLTYESTKESRLVTVLNWELYQSTDKDLTKQLTNGSQRGNKDLTTNKNVRTKECKNKEKIYSSSHMTMAEKLKALMLQNNPGAKTPDDLTKWVAEFDKMTRLDKRTLEQINVVMEFSQKDSFWKSNILSAKKLREKFDTLLLQKDRPKQAQQNTTPQKGNFEQRSIPSDEEIDRLYKL